MTRKDYTIIAAALRDAAAMPAAEGRKSVNGATMLSMVKDALCKALKQDNPSFNPDRFNNAC